MDTNKSVAIVLDWDDVVADTHSYKQDLFVLLESYGIDHNKSYRMYQSSKDHEGYHPKHLAEMVAADTKNNYQTVLNDIDQLALNTKNYLYPDAVKLIDNGLERGYDVYVLTAGEVELQSQKIDSSDLIHKFKEVKIVHAGDAGVNKAAELRLIAKNHTRVYFFDDKLSTIDHLQQQFQNGSNIIPFLVDRNQNQSTSSAVNIVSQLSIDDLP